MAEDPTVTLRGLSKPEHAQTEGLVKVHTKVESRFKSPRQCILALLFWMVVHPCMVARTLKTAIEQTVFSDQTFVSSFFKKSNPLRIFITYTIIIKLYCFLWLTICFPRHFDVLWFYHWYFIYFKAKFYPYGILILSVLLFDRVIVNIWLVSFQHLDMHWLMILREQTYGWLIRIDVLSLPPLSHTYAAQTPYMLHSLSD